MNAYMTGERGKGTHNKDMCTKRMLSKPTTYRISMNRHPEATFACIA
jgi:outer membrane lipoprotein-sorting protein